VSAFLFSHSAGAVSFTHIVKASEPAVSAALTAVVLKSFLPLPVYLTLIPVMAGVALSSVSELTFTWKALNYAMMSNVASASRAIVGKRTMAKHPGGNMNALNTFAVLSILSVLLVLPVTLLVEGRIIVPNMKMLFSTGKIYPYSLYTVVSALCYYIYNEVAFLCLDRVSTVSHAVANTVKRIFIIVSSMLVFGNKMTPQGVLGSVLAVGGVLVYSLTKHHYNKKEAASQQAKKS
jgi:solute carrier family 35 protein E1